MHPQWENFCYHYGVGGIVFVLSMKLLFSSGALKWERPSDQFLTKGLVFGLVSFMLVHGVWIASVT